MGQRRVVILGAVLVLCLATVASAGTNLGRTYNATVATGAYSGNGTWTMTVGANELTLECKYDAKGNLTGTATVDGTDFPISGKMKLSKKGLTFSFKSTDKSIAKMAAKGTVDGEAKTIEGSCSLTVGGLGITEKKTPCDGTLPPGSTDVLQLQFNLTQDAAGKIGGTMVLTDPSGAQHPSDASGAIKEKKGTESVKLGATDKTFKMKGGIEGPVLSSLASVKVPGFKLKKLPVAFVVSEFTAIIDADFFAPFTTSASPLPVEGNLVDVDGVGYPPSISWTSSGGSGVLDVAEDGSFSGSIPLAAGDNIIDIGFPTADPLAMITTTFNEGFDFGGRLQMDPDIVYINQGRQVTATIAITDPNLDPGTVELIRLSDQSVLATLVDNGDLNSGDEIEADGIFSGRFFLTEPAEGFVETRVSLTHSGGTTAQSEVSRIRVTTPVTAADIQTMEDVQDQHQATLEVTPPEQIPGMLDQIVETVQEQPGVEAAGVSEGGLGAWIVYESGLLGVIYAPAEQVKSGGGRLRGLPPPLRRAEENLPPPRYRYTSFYHEQNSRYRGRSRSASSTTDPNKIGSNKVFAIAAQFFDWGNSDDIPLMQQTLKDNGCYDVVYKTYTSSGTGSVEDFKNWGGYGIVLVSSHGDSFFAGIPGFFKDIFGWNGPFGQVVLHTNAAVTVGSSTTYADDLKQGRLVRWGSNFGVLPGFVTKYTGSMPNSWVYMSICRGTWNGTLAGAFLGRGAGTFMGYSDYVAVSFCQTNGTKTLTELLKPGQNMTQGFTAGIKETDSDPAEYRLYGNKMLDIQITGLQNGGFECPVSQTWTVVGDGRRIPALGASAPKEGTSMGIISTGLGFTVDSGSISQVFCAGADATEISFWWNYFSEEFLEFVGSQFQDTFEVTVENAKDGTGKTTLLFKTVDGTNAAPGVVPVANSFDQGDVYATGWQKFTGTIPAGLLGKPIRLTFRVFDVGDSIYDTAVIFDDVKVEKPAP